jgi:hypothetical protein
MNSYKYLKKEFRKSSINYFQFITEFKKIKFINDQKDRLRIYLLSKEARLLIIKKKRLQDLKELLKEKIITFDQYKEATKEI